MSLLVNHLTILYTYLTYTIIDFDYTLVRYIDPKNSKIKNIKQKNK